ncbi:hypothetical protein TYRP_005871 [Tyrophagus putrescentiae]|nr:hypothetical protein TYRP_005871 [Tyrophagus putrescentiae]
MANFAQWISLTLEIIERNAQQPSVYINFAKHILLSGQNLLLVAKSLNRHYSQLRSLATFADSFYEYLRMIVLKTKRAAAGAGAGVVVVVAFEHEEKEKESLLPPPAPSDLRLRVGGVFGAEGVWIPRGRHDGELSPAQRVRRLGHLNGVLGVPLFELFLR